MNSSRLYNICDLIVTIPTAGGMSSRCREYICNQNKEADIVINENEYKLDNWPTLSVEDAIYLESGFQFYRKLLNFEGLMLHASAVEVDGYAYLFSGPCGVGKSTHTRLWQKICGERAQVFNDDKPALRGFEDGWYAYGTPWCGKDGINQNKKVKLGGICFLTQGEFNNIRKLRGIEAISRIISQTGRRFKKTERLDLMLDIIENLIRDIPIYELTNNAEEDSAKLSYETMRKGVEELGL